ncbi:hypothetical protein OG689_00495 [Kitasatospora sp. NBC_00240]|uniref:hypothetical protein n=1 Tax=Kitasatospora sp. NBC_00240 TaxID=2903567 RepID=UPI00224D9504|nr:hypothetical protein [Kitasatospora sp. NBC_00240]MCX5207812.1 hypothetical protein [Kitasatospora sp. NBC_00240]
MDGDLRRAAAVALGELGRSQGCRDRADAGHGLAGLAETQEARRLLAELVLDPGDTWVTRVTSVALLRHKDDIGLQVVASALAVADSNHTDWIHTAVNDVFSIYSDDRDNAMRWCEEMSRNFDAPVALGARQLYEMLAESEPIFGPAQRG